MKNKTYFRNWIQTDAAYFSIVAFLLYAILFVVFYNKYFYSFGPDFVSYYAIAKQYAAGDFGNAVHSWWSPMYSWLLAIFLKLQVNPLVANKLLQFFIGWYGFIIAKILVHFFCTDIPKKWLHLGTLAFIPFLTVWALQSDTPDLLSAVLLLHFLRIALLLKQNFTLRHAFMAGLVGACCYWAKAYNFYFITAFAIVLFIWQYFFTRSIIVVKNFFIVSFFFLLVASLWIAALGYTTNKVQLSSIGIHRLCPKR
jgi:hypothetical protein